MRELRDEKLLSDAIINSVMLLINCRSERTGSKVFCFSTYFYYLLSRNKDLVGNTTTIINWLEKRNIDLTAFDKVIVPLQVHNNHWTLAVLNIKEKKIEYLDSLITNAGTITGLRIIADLQFFHDRVCVTTKVPEDCTNWTIDMFSKEDIPQQCNGKDCGVFLCTFASLASLDKPYDSLTGGNMTKYRRMIASCIFYKKI